MGRRRARETNVSKRLLGVVLCGGRSIRMGRDKATLLHPSGVTFIQHAINRLQSLCPLVVISGRTTADCNLTIIDDPIANRGPATGIAAALSYCLALRYDGILVTPVDTPFLTVNDLQQICDHWQTTDSVTLAQAGRLQPLIGIYPVALSEQIRQLAESSDCSLIRWFGSHDHHVVELPEASCRNINTPDDLSTLQRN
jgi:molybdenum cofactor guanylyltransferase